MLGACAEASQSILMKVHVDRAHQMVRWRKDRKYFEVTGEFPGLQRRFLICLHLSACRRTWTGNRKP